MIQKEAWSFYRTISGVRLYWVLEKPKGSKGLNAHRLARLYPGSGGGIKYDPKEIPGRSWGPSVRRINLLADEGMFQGIFSLGNSRVLPLIYACTQLMRGVGA